MINQIKSDYYKLRHSRMLFAVSCAYFFIFLLYMVLYTYGPQKGVSFMASGGETTGILGFFVKTYSDMNTPMFWEICRSSMSNTIFFWMVAAVFTVMYLSKEYRYGTIKLSVAYGISKFRIFLSKFLITACYTGICYYLMAFLSLAFTLIKTHYCLTVSDFGEFMLYTSLNFLVLIVFILLCLLVELLLKNIAYSVTLMYLFIFAGLVFVDASWAAHQSWTLIQNALARINPSYYWLRICGYSHTTIEIETILYFVIGSAFLFLMTGLILKKQEIK